MIKKSMGSCVCDFSIATLFVMGTLNTALTAFAMDKQIAAAFDPSSANCYVNRFQVVQ